MKNFKRVLAMLLVAMMVLSVPELSTTIAWGLEDIEDEVSTEDAVEESTEDADVEGEEENTKEERVNQELTESSAALENKDAGTNASNGKEVVSVVFEETEPMQIGTTGYAFSLMTEADSVVSLKEGSDYEKWINRLNMPEYGTTLYNLLVEASDNDGVDDYLIEDTYFSTTNGNYSSGYNLIEITMIENATDEDFSNVTKTVYAAAEAFDRDYPGVFWMSGYVSVVRNTLTYGDGSTEVYYYYALKNHNSADGIDVRSDDYQSESAIKAGITTRDNAINAIYTEEVAALSTFEKIDYFNDWLTTHNAYCTAATFPTSSYECLSALTGQTGETGPVCEAYSRAFMLLCQKAGIPCVLEDGYAGEAHMWNAVELENNWYVVDVTWNDPMVPDGNGGYITTAISGYESDAWLLLGTNTIPEGEDETFASSHTQQNTPGMSGFAYLNGPDLSEDAYEPSIIASITANNEETTYGYGASTAPSLSITLVDGATGTLTYQWYDCWVDENDNIHMELLDGETSATLSLGKGFGVYACQAYYDGEELEDGYGVYTVYPKLLTVNGESIPKVYDGNTNANVTLSLKAEEIINDDDVSVVFTSATYDDANAGEDKIVTVTGIALSGTDKDNYMIGMTEGELSGTINPADISDATVTLEKETYYYTAAAQNVKVASVVLDGTTLKASDYTVSGHTQVSVGNGYTVTVTGTGNYTGSATATYDIAYLPASNVTVKYNDNTSVLDWYTKDVVITAAGYTVSETVGGTYKDSYTVTGDGEYSSKTLYFKQNDTGYITEGIAISAVSIDATAPSFADDGYGIKVSSNFWKKLLNTITFDLFFKENQDVSIKAEDVLSGIDSYYYYVDKSGSTEVLSSDELEDVTFTALAEDAKFSLTEDNNYVIYAYAVDVAGNKSDYICSEGIVIDTVAPTATFTTPTVENGYLMDTSAIVEFILSEAVRVDYGAYTTGPSTSVEESYNKSTQIAEYDYGGEFFISFKDLEPNTTYYAEFVLTDKAQNTALYIVTFTTQKTIPVISTQPTITGTYGQTLGEMTLTGPATSVNGIPGSWAVSTSDADIMPEVGTSTEYVVTFTPNDTESYGTYTTKVVPTVSKKEITVTVNDATRKYKEANPTFTFTTDGLVGDDTIADLGLVASTNATTASNVGAYTITATADADNYDVTIVNGKLDITKLTYSGAITPFAKEYVYALGSEGKNVYVNVSSRLPEDHGGVIFDADCTDDIITLNGTSDTGDVSYIVKNTGAAGDTATITVTAKCVNYEDITIVINITLVDKLSVSLEGSVSTIGTLTYGDKLSDITFGTATFKDTQGNTVTGILTWNTPNEVLEVGTHTVTWTFTPSNADKYKTATGTLSVSVKKATPNVETPTTDGITYNPSATLADVTINGANGKWNVGGTESAVAGTWTWKESTTVPTVGNTGYVVIFTPEDSDNYNTVEKTVTVEVAKATPVVSEAPLASDIVYLNTLKDSVLTGGKVVYSNDSDVVVEGTFAWEDATIKPVVADSATTDYNVVFTPNDTDNYNTVVCVVKVVVAKAEKPENTPESTMDADYDTTKVSDIVLPEGWTWAEDDAETALEKGVEVTATAKYTAEDAANYETLEVVITITRLTKAPHIEGDEGTMGWDAIEEEIKAEDTTEVRVDMNGFTEISGDTLEVVRDEEVTLVVVIDEDITWTIKGSDIKEGEFADLDLEAELFAKDADDKPAIPSALVESVVSKAKDYKFLSLSHDGEFGFTAVLKFNVGKENAGKLATLYYYDEVNAKMTKESTYKVDADGNVEYTFEHASDYVISIEDEAQEEKPDETPGGDTDDGILQEGDNLVGIIFLYSAIILAGAAMILVGVRRRRER